MLAKGITPAQMQARVKQFAPETIEANTADLEPWERQVLARLVRASQVINRIFLLQVSPHNPDWRHKLASEHGAGQQAALTYFDIMAGPWDRLDHNQPFLDVGPKPPGAGFYPKNFTAKDFENWLQNHPEDLQDFRSPYTVIRSELGKLIAVTYPLEYHKPLVQADTLLQEAAIIARPHNASLADFLSKRGVALVSNDYYPSDLAWMDIHGSRIEPTIGPYEVYEDNLEGLKASFESYVTVADSAASAELAQLKTHLPELESSLPEADKYKNMERGFESPIRVVDVVFTSGEARAGVQTMAFNLPNDERVRKAKGSKKVMLRNVARAKFNAILMPIARLVLDSSLVAQIEFKPWFTNVLMHELAHGLGPGFITGPNGQKETVNQALRDKYSAIEEAKADVTGLHNMTVLEKQGVFSADFVRRAFIGHLADIFRAVRFGSGEAHGQANLLQFNWLLQKGAIHADSAGRFSADLPRVVEANRELAHTLLTLEATGDYKGATQLLEKYGTEPPALKNALARLTSVPVDIRPVYPALDSLDAWAAGH